MIMIINSEYKANHNNFINTKFNIEGRHENEKLLI